MRIEVYNAEKHREPWEDFVENRARNAHFMHTRRFLDYHGERIDDESLVFYGDRPEPLALLPAHRLDGILVSHRGLSFGGLLVGNRFRLSQWERAFSAIGQHLREAALEGLDYRPTPAWHQRQAGEEDVFLIESAGVRAELLASAICRMDGDFLGNATRRTESRSEVSLGRDDVSLGELMGLVAETLRLRHMTEPVHSLSEMLALASRFPDAIRAYTARSGGGELLAGVVLFLSDAAVKLQYVGYSHSYAMSAIYGHLFSLDEFHGRWFDFGTSMAGGTLESGLFTYKESLGGKLALVRRYQIPVGAKLFTNVRNA